VKNRLIAWKKTDTNKGDEFKRSVAIFCFVSNLLRH